MSLGGFGVHAIALVGFFWQHVQHVCTTNLCVYDTFNHQLARLPTFGNLCHFVNCRTTPSQPQMTTPWIRMILLCNSSVYTRTNRTNALKHFYSWSAKLCPRTNTKTHTHNIYIHTRIYNERTLYMLSNYDTIKTCVYGRILFEVYVLQSLLYACVYFARICRFLFVCMCIYMCEREWNRFGLFNWLCMYFYPFNIVLSFQTNTLTLLP